MTGTSDAWVFVGYFLVLTDFNFSNDKLGIALNDRSILFNVGRLNKNPGTTASSFLLRSTDIKLGQSNLETSTEAFDDFISPSSTTEFSISWI